MSTQRHGPDLVRDWLDESYEAEREPGRFLDHLLDAVPTVPQRRRRWWQRKQTSLVASPSATDTTVYQPSPVQATNGHSPTVIGRTRSMLSPAKAIAAAALVVALGGVMLVAQPFQQRAVLPGAETEEPAAPVAVTATSAAGACPGLATTETIGFIERSTGGWCRPTWTWSDERLNGEVTWASNEDVYIDGESGLTISLLALSFQNDEGAWRMRPLPLLDFPEAPATAADVWVLDGEGAYEGLTAVLLVEEYLPHGFIIEGDLPPAPENASTK